MPLAGRAPAAGPAQGPGKAVSTPGSSAVDGWAVGRGNAGRRRCRRPRPVRDVHFSGSMTRYRLGWTATVATRCGYRR